MKDGMVFKEFKGKNERSDERHWITGVVVMMDENGNIVIDNSLRHFNDKIDREATHSDVIQMFRTKLREFEVEETAQIVVKELNRLMKQTGK